MFKLNVQTDQEAFDTVVRHLATMPHRSMRQGRGRCLYAGPDGLRCAASVLIDASYDDVKQLDTWDESGIRCLVEGGFVDVGDVNESILHRLQVVHDDVASWDEREGGGFVGWNALAHIAERYDLSTSVLDEFAGAPA